MTRAGNQDIVAELFGRLQREFGNMAPMIIKVMVETVGGVRMTFPDLQDLYRSERNRRLRSEFTGFNYEELAIKYRLKCRQVRRILTSNRNQSEIMS
jgi:Mor family transcriptional regulator